MGIEVRLCTRWLALLGTLLFVASACSSSPDAASSTTAKTAVTSPTTNVSPQVSSTEIVETSTTVSIADADIVYLALGDSNVYGSPYDCGHCITYPHLLSELLRTQTAKSVALIDGSEHNRETTRGLLSAINDNVWSEPSEFPIRSDLEPRDAIAAANVITITLGANQIPWYQDTDPCQQLYDDACLQKIEQPAMADFDAILSQIDEIRAGKPTAVRVTTFHNDLIAGPGYTPLFSHAATAQALTSARTFLDAWSKDLCAVAANHGALCVDIYRLLAGPQGDQPLPTGFYSSDYGDLNQAGQQFYADAIADSLSVP